MRESIGVHHGALLRIPGDVPAYREDRPNGIGSSSNRIQTAHQKCRVLTEPTHSRMVAYSEVTVELESFLHHSREVSFWEVRTRDFCRDSALSFGNNLKPRGTDESVYPHSRSVGEEGAVLFYSEGHRHGRCFALPAVDVLVQSEMEKNFF